MPGLGRGPIPIAAAEFAERRRRAVALARERGLDGLLVWSRGGASADWYGDVYYLANYHTAVPPLANSARWSGKGHCALVLATDAAPILLADNLDDPDDRIQVADARVAQHLPDAVAAALAETGLSGKTVGLVGENALLVRDFERLQAALDAPTRFERADDLLEGLRFVKSEAELELIRHAAHVGCAWMNATLGAVRAGRTEGEVVGEGLRVLAAQGGHPYDVAISSGPAVEHFWGSLAIPHWNAYRSLEDGDLLHVDQWGPVQGYLTDFARSTVVGRTPTDGQRELLEGAVALIDHIIDGMAVGVTLDALHRRGVDWLSANDFAEAAHSFGDIFPSFGHSMGLVVEPPYLIESELTQLQANSVIAVEGLVGRSGVGAAGFEHNVIVTDEGVEVLDAACPTRWWD